MKPMTYSQFRENMKKSMDMVCESRTPLTITRRDAEPVVVMSLEEYSSMQETFYLLRSPRNAERLLRSIAELNKGNGRIVEP